MTVHTGKPDNGLTLTIPEVFASELGLAPNSPADISLCGAAVIIRSARQPRGGAGRFAGTGNRAEPAYGNRHRRRRGTVPMVIPNAGVPERRDVVWLYFTPQRGHEQAGRRPALVLSP